MATKFGELKIGNTFQAKDVGYVWMKTADRDTIRIGVGAYVGCFDKDTIVTPVTLKVDDGTPDPKTADELARMIGEFRTCRKNMYRFSHRERDEWNAETEWIIAGRLPKPVTFGDLKVCEPFQMAFGKPSGVLCKSIELMAIRLSEGGQKWDVVDSAIVTRLTWREAADILEGTKEKADG